MVKSEQTDLVVGRIVKADKQGILVATGKDWLLVTKLQLPGKKPISAADVLNGRADWFVAGSRLL